MAYSKDVKRFGFLLQKAIIAVQTTQEQYDYYYGLRRDDTGKYIKGPSFSASAEKSAKTRLMRAISNLRNMELFWNNLYAVWRDYEIRFDDIESRFTQTEIDSEKMTQQMNDIQTAITVSASENARAVLVTEYAKVCFEQDRILRKREHLRGMMHKMANNKPLQVISLEDIKSTLTVIDNKVTQIIDGSGIRVVPESLKPLQADIIRRNKADHVRIEPKTPNPMDEFMKGFFNDSPKVQDNDTTEKEN